MNGQWIGKYQGASTGLIVVNIDERRAQYQGVAYLSEDNKDLPSVATFFRTRDKNERFEFRTDLILPINPFSGLPDSWDRTVEIEVNTLLFDKEPPAPAPKCQSTFMDIRLEDGISWIAINPESAPTETWYQTTLYYDFKFEISPNTYIPITGARAVFTVRDVGKFEDKDHHWQLVEFRDLGDE